MRLKEGVSIRGFKPETVVGTMIVGRVCNDKGMDYVITSGSDGQHSEGSLHYLGYAFDVRTWTSSGVQMSHMDKKVLAKQFRDALGGEFDVVVEPSHIHIEYQPEGPING